MFFDIEHSSLFAAFDIYPSAKGASTHIFHNSETLFEFTNGGWMFVLGSPKLQSYQKEGNIEITRFQEDIPNFLYRTQAYGEKLLQLLSLQNQLKICHFRDPWSGLPILINRKKQQKNYVCIYEVNGLPSIELPFRYPKLTNATLQKIAGLENYCLRNTDYIICPSEVIKANLVKTGVSPQKIEVITNGADTPQKLEKPDTLPEKYIIYFGALQPWQGLDILMKAFTYLADYPEIQLVICSSTRSKYSKSYQKLADKLHITERIIWNFQLSKKELYEWVHHAMFSIAPLTECSRNLQQGCCPLKILESMALKTPVIASDIPAVREIINHEQLGRLVRPGRPAEFARAMRILIEYPELREKIATEAFEHILKNFTWEQKREDLKRFYTQIMHRHFVL